MPLGSKGWGGGHTVGLVTDDCMPVCFVLRVFLNGISLQWFWSHTNPTQVTVPFWHVFCQMICAPYQNGISSCDTGSPGILYSFTDIHPFNIQITQALCFPVTTEA